MSQWAWHLRPARILGVFKTILDPMHAPSPPPADDSPDVAPGVAPLVAPDFSADPIVRLVGAAVHFPGGAAPVWENLNLALHPGECLTLLGPSGCGKSTVLRVMAGLQPLSGGQLANRSEAPAFVFQDAALLPWAELHDNVSLPLKVRGLPAPQRSALVQQVLGRVGLSGRETALPHELSGGMKMRASIARALVMTPDLLLMDEPFSALDDPTRQRLQADLLQWWQAQGFALCFVTHQVAEAVFMSSRIVVMGAHPARIVAEISVDEPYPRAPEFRRSARFHAISVRVADALAQATSDAFEGAKA